VRLNVGFLWSWLAANPANGDPLPAAKLPLIHRAAVEACDALDGVRDGVIDDPRACRFDPGALLCKADDNAACLTAAQAAAVRKIYDGAHNPRTGERLFAGWPRGSEEGWTAYFVGQREPARLDFWRYWVFGDPEWNPRTFDFDGDVAFADAAIAAAAATSVDLAAFQKRGGKLLAYHGTADPVSPPEDSIGYYEHVRDASGGEQKMQSFYRLFLVPGMGHCGPAEFDALAAVDRWVSQGIAPDRLAVKDVDGRTRSLCPFPQVGCR
jgi:feruloyl esterase